MQFVRGVFAGRPWRRVFAAVIALAVLNAVRAVVFPRMFGLPMVMAIILCECGASIAAGALMARENVRVRAAQQRRRDEMRTPTAPDVGPDTCRVCGLGDLAYWDDLDAQFEAVGDDRHVVGYGSGRAHRDCALVVPYEAPKPDPQREIVRLLQRANTGPTTLAHGTHDGYVPEEGAVLSLYAVGDLAPGEYELGNPGEESAVRVRVMASSGPQGWAGAYRLTLASPLDRRFPCSTVLRPARCSPVVTEWGAGKHSGSFTLCRNPEHHPGDPQCTVSGVFLASVRAACGIPTGPGEPEPSNIASDLINAGLLSVDDARRLAIDGMPAADGTLERSVGLGVYWTCRYCNTRRWADSGGGAENALRKHSGSCAERRAGGDQACAAMYTYGRGTWCAVHREGDPRCAVIRDSDLGVL